MSSEVPPPIVTARRIAGAILTLSLMLVLIAIALLANWYRTRPVIIAAPTAVGRSTSPSGPSGSSTATPQTPTPSTPSASASTPSKTSKLERERTALARLRRQAASDLAITSLDDQWAAQLSSKYIGVTDDYQRTASGSDKFEAVDILAEYDDLFDRYDADYDVRLLRGEDFYPNKTHGKDTFWYVFAFGDFYSKNSVTQFCEDSYPKLSGDALLNHCKARQMKSEPPLEVDGKIDKLTYTALQRALNKNHGEHLVIDGVMGKSTRSALQRALEVPVTGKKNEVTVKALQRYVGADPDGVWGNETTLMLQYKLNAGDF